MKSAILLLLITAGTVTGALAQKDDQAKAILSQVSKKYRTYDVVKTSFTYTLESPQANLKETQSGTLIAKSKTNKFKVTLYTKGGTKTQTIAQELISNGKEQWTYLKKDNEVQVNDVNNSDDALNPAHIFTIYEKGFKYLYTGESKVGGVTYQNIDLTPTDDKKTFFKVRLMIDKVKKQIYSALIFDKNGNKYTYAMQSFSPNANVPDAVFAFDVKAHPGVEVVDLR
ncbi:outer membrane lipoprotein carrier protein LolA [Mucilaginibacter sp. HMF5004]|nr:outer membrane lipoprotein carrier protein LolA [Mucilaginibacter rivuli]